MFLVLFNLKACNMTFYTTHVQLEPTYQHVIEYNLNKESFLGGNLYIGLLWFVSKMCKYTQVKTRSLNVS